MLPSKMPSFAESWRKPGSNARLDTNRAIVKPMPASIPPPRRVPQEYPEGLFEMPIFTARKEKMKMPIGFPTIKAIATAIKTETSIPPPSLISTPALARAKTGIIK